MKAGVQISSKTKIEMIPVRKAKDILLIAMVATRIEMKARSFYFPFSDNPWPTFDARITRRQHSNNTRTSSESQNLSRNRLDLNF